MNGADAFRDAIRAELGTAPDVIEPGRLVRFATDGKPGNRDGWALHFADGRCGVFGDWSRPGEAPRVWVAEGRPDRMTPRQRAELRRALAQQQAERERAQREAWRHAGERVAELLRQSHAVPADGSGGDPLTRYLRHRTRTPAGSPLAIPAALRLHPGLPYFHDGERVGTWPAMLAEMRAPSGELVAVHRTWLTADGRKAPTPGPVKKLTRACGPVMGACIRLGEPLRGILGVAEGIETALSAREASGLPVVAAYSAGALAAWVWPRGVHRVVVFADADDAGQQAANALRHRARAAGLSVELCTPTEPGTDWADVWASREVSA